MAASKKSEALNGALPKLQALYRFMTEHELDTLEIDEEDWHVRLTRRTQAPAPVMAPMPAAGVAAAAAQAPAPALGAVPAGAVTVKSSMMGIFYRAASPSSPPFVKEGDAVKAGQVLCMIEAMKVFNEIKAEFACTIGKVLLENGKPVKSGQDLFIVQRT